MPFTLATRAYHRSTCLCARLGPIWNIKNLCAQHACAPQGRMPAQNKTDAARQFRCIDQRHSMALSGLAQTTRNCVEGACAKRCRARRAISSARQSGKVSATAASTAISNKRKPSPENKHPEPMSSPSSTPLGSAPKASAQRAVAPGCLQQRPPERKGERACRQRGRFHGRQRH